jgi:transposase
MHSVSSEKYSRYYPHARRGKEAMDEMGILEEAEGILIHDYWKAYYGYRGKEHGLCNAHLIRELTMTGEEGQKWAEPMIEYLLGLNEEVEKGGGKLGIRRQEEEREEYRKILKRAEKENPEPPPKPPGKRGRLPKTKSRNLMERMRDREDEVLRFMTKKEVPFTNNLAERDLRMTKVQQKISGCFRSWAGAKIFCRIRGYLSTCSKNNISAAAALNLLFDDKLPEFVSYSEISG